MAKEKHSKMTSDRMFQRTSRFLQEEAAPDVIDRGTGVSRDMVLKLKMGDKPGGQDTPHTPSPL